MGRRVLAAFLGVSLVPLLVTAVLGYWRSVAMVDGYLADSVGRTAHAWAADVDLFLERQRTLLRTIPTAGPEPDALLAAAAAGDPSLEALVLVGADGTPIAASGQAVDPWVLDACRALAGDPAPAMTHAGEGHAHEVVVAVPRGGGVLCGQVTFTLHQDMLTERAHSAFGGTAYIVDRSGTVVCHAFEEHEPHVGRGDHLAAPASEIASSSQPWSGVLDGAGGRVFAAFASADGLPWGVWVEVPREVATGPLREWLWQTLGYAAVFAAGVCVLALVVVRGLVSPLQDMVAAARTIASGRYGEAVPVRGGDDEVAELAREFNRMSVALQRSYTELDDRVARRTRQLQAAREFSDLLLDTMRERILVIDDDLDVVRANDAALEAYGDGIVGCGCKQVHRLAGTASEVCPARRVLDSGRMESEERVYERNGRTEILAVDTYPIAGEDGRPEAVVEIARDVTELKRIQAQLMHQEKMASLGTLAAGLAHEIGNPLASMSSELELLERMWDPDEARASLPVLRDQVRRISELLRELVQFGRRPSEEAATFAPAEVLDDVARLLQHDPRSRGVAITVRAEAGVDCLCTSRDRLVQVLVNLGLNALDALDGAGVVTFHVAREPTGGLRFEVADDGPGVPEDVARQVFDPFFTTKPPGKGTGLGLFVSERIVQSLGGRMELHSPGSGGTTFAVVLPRCSCDQQETPAHA